MFHTVAVAFAVVLCTFPALAQPISGTIPAQNMNAFLPRITVPITIDGDLKEWAGATSFPLRFDSYISVIEPQHVWRGAVDAGAEIFCGWNDSGLCVAAKVTDDEVINNKESGEYWQQDCIELFLDGRADSVLLRAPMGKGNYQILIKPPTADKPVALVTAGGKLMRDCPVAATRTAGGYTIETIIPWANFPGFMARSKTRLGFSCNLDDYDSRDRDFVKPLEMCWLAKGDLFFNSQHSICWTLVDSLPADTNTALGPTCALEFPLVYSGTAPMPVTIETGVALSQKAARAQLTIMNSSQSVIISKPLLFSGAKAPWQNSKRALYSWDCSKYPDGVYTITATLFSADGKPLGTTRRATVLIKSVLPNSLNQLKVLNLPAITQTSPYTAMAWTGAAVTVERLKRAIAMKDQATALASYEEFGARCSVLTNPSGSYTASFPYDLLVLGANSLTQVTVEFPPVFPPVFPRNQAFVSFYWGAYPLGQAIITATDSAHYAMISPGSLHYYPPYGVTLSKFDKNRRIDIEAASDKLAQAILRAVTGRKPVTEAQVDTMRQLLVRHLASIDKKELAPDSGMELFTGDVHSHSFYSDGNGSPASIALQSIYCGMDFAVITDHNTLTGVQKLQVLCKQTGLRQPAIVGEEITLDALHLCAYPLTAVVGWKQSVYAIAQAVHAQNAVLQWNHPTAADTNETWVKQGLASGIAFTGVDAWEHVPPKYSQWVGTSRLPAVIGSTDSHTSTNEQLERTIICAPAATGEALAEAIRNGHCALFDPTRPEVIYTTNPAMRAMILKDLSNGSAVKSTRANRVRAALKNFNGIGFLQGSKPQAEF